LAITSPGTRFLITIGIRARAITATAVGYRRCATERLRTFAALILHICAR
jgi:hypothetical protein